MTTAEIVDTPEERLPFKVIFFKDGEIIAERPVGSEDAGRRLISSLLPLLQKHDDG